MSLLENIEIKSWDQLINVGTVANYFVNYASVNPEDIKLLPKNMQEELAVVVMLFIRNALAITGKEFEVIMSRNDNALIKNLKKTNHVIFKAFEGVYNDINNLNENDIFIEPKTNFSIGVSFPNLLILLKGVKVYKEEDLIVTFKHWIDCLAQKKDIANLNIFEYIYSITIKDEKLRFSIELPNDEIPKEIVEQNIKNTINTIIKSLKEKKRVKEVFDSEYGESLTQKLLMESDLKELNLSTVKSKKLKF